MSLSLIIPSHPRLLPATPRASTVVLIRQTDTKPELLLIKRAARPGDPWSGHIGLPGGRQDPADLLKTSRDADADYVTARREVKEELGVDISLYNLLGRLDDRYIYHWFSSLHVMVLSVFVVVIPSDVEVVFSPSAKEVERIIWVDIGYLRRWMGDFGGMMACARPQPILARMPLSQMMPAWSKSLLNSLIGQIHFPAIPLANEEDQKEFIWGITLHTLSTLLDKNSVSPAQLDWQWTDVNLLLRLTSSGVFSDQDYNWGMHAQRAWWTCMTLRAALVLTWFLLKHKAKL
jgi:8-oxo-dGTP pyrophosphatase MutT (NUDIX family)